MKLSNLGEKTSYGEYIDIDVIAIYLGYFKPNKSGTLRIMK